jgi:hypothetical protein
VKRLEAQASDSLVHWSGVRMEIGHQVSHRFEDPLGSSGEKEARMKAEYSQFRSELVYAKGVKKA